jgi:hypothetical protein
VQTINLNLNLKESTSPSTKDKSEKSASGMKTLGSTRPQGNIIPLSTKNEGPKPKIFQNIQVNLKSSSPKAVKKTEVKK